MNPSTSSSAAAQPLCQSCGVAPARNFLCQISNGNQTNLALCDDCMRARPDETSHAALGLHGARCMYCGGAANCGGADQVSAILTGKKGFEYYCFRCAALLSQFTLEVLGSLPRDLPADEQHRRVQQLTSEVDERIRNYLRSLSTSE